ncbi:polysaccharide biosynthesis/export family protein [Urechidicola vernalis]|uniref:Polysaccharide biosynthesis/export family protein n=1 Tax=Urechidicola vernalis TaxID=3075600 RepID=A0ABU2Y290_9FLAO|nr:polysaccharide biosynthesis/export family protein [Urechidicola sp. P050]MDT0552322.1 polysaccharide biosynthesis/export family protein [Urechidicola sp. P050]
MKKNIVYLLIIMSLSSCLSLKKTTYFQGEPSEKSEMYKFNNEPYRVQVNDVLSVEIVSENPDLVSLFGTSEEGSGGNLYFDGYTVDRHGNIRIPYINEVNVLGYTEKEIREKIEMELKKFIKNAETFFVKVKLSGIQFLVNGEVNSPGTINLMQNQVSIIDAIASAGEIADFGNRQEVQIYRKTLNGVERYTVDLTDVAIFDSEHYYIKPNDIIYVPPLQRKNWGIGTTGLSTFTTIASIFAVLTSTILLIDNL